MMRVLLLALLFTFIAASDVDRPSPQAVNPSVCVTKLGKKPGSKCICKVWIKGKVKPPQYYLKWTCPTPKPKKTKPTSTKKPQSTSVKKSQPTLVTKSQPTLGLSHSTAPTSTMNSQPTPVKNSHSAARASTNKPQPFAPTSVKK